MTQETAGVTVIVIPQPTVNGPLHIGHLSGPYLGADIAARAARARGERVLSLAGVDVHPNYVLTKAENLGMDVGEMVAKYRAQIMSAFRGAGISYDAFLDPQDPQYRQAIAGMLRELVETGTVPMREVTLLADSPLLRRWWTRVVRVAVAHRARWSSRSLSCGWRTTVSS